MRLRLRDYQEDCVQAHWDFFARDKEGNPLFVVPTRGGKSLIMAEFVRHSLDAWPETRILNLTHVRELIVQNHAEFVGHHGDDQIAGIYSAGVGRRDTDSRVLFAGVQSVWKKAEQLGFFHLVMIDEAHLVPKKGMGQYRTLLADLKEINPRLRILGYTATPYRLDGGYLHRGKDALFTEIAYEVEVERLLTAGHLIPLVAKKPENTIDVDGVGTSSGDFKKGELEAAATKEGMVDAAVDEAVQLCREEGRKSWLFYCCGIHHAGEVLARLAHHEVTAAAVFGKTPREERDAITRAFKEGEITALVNVSCLTTGFNAPRCDALVVMRPTKSTALYVQIFGRGMTPFPGLDDCLVLDYGENVRRHGPINMVKPKRQSDEPGAPPTKVCPECSTISLIGTNPCPSCGYEWPASEMEVEHARQAAYENPIAYKGPETLPVTTCFYREHKKSGSSPTLRVDYVCGMSTISEWVCFEHEGYPGRKARLWWRARRSAQDRDIDEPQTVADALARIFEGGIVEPLAIEVWPDGPYKRVRRAFFEEKEAESAIARYLAVRADKSQRGW